MRNVLYKRSELLDVLTAYIPYLMRAREQFTEYRMHYWDNDPADYDEPEVSDDEWVLDTVIDVLKKARDIDANGRLAIPYRIGTTGYEDMMREILGEEEAK